MKKKKRKNQIENTIILICIISEIVFIILFMNSFHNIDLQYNMNSIFNSLNNAGIYDINKTLIIFDSSKLQDTGSDYITRKLSDYYIPSMNNLILYFVLSNINIFILGLLLSNKFKEEK